MSYLLVTMLVLALALVASAALMAIAVGLGRARGGARRRLPGESKEPLAPTRHPRLVRMGDLSN